MNHDQRFMALLLVLVGSLVWLTGTSSWVMAGTSQENIREQFGPVLKLEGNARKEINAIANILGPSSKMKPIDATKASGEMCMLEDGNKTQYDPFFPDT